MVKLAALMGGSTLTGDWINFLSVLDPKDISSFMAGSRSDE